jgi:hypothetical protein
MPPKKQNDVWVAKETFAAEDDNGSPVIIHAGKTRIREGHPLLDRYREHFQPADSRLDFDIEQATAAPGEKRGAAS